MNDVAVVWSISMNWACQLGLPDDNSPTWKTATGTEINNVNFCRSLWFLMYIFGYQGYILYDLPIPETCDISSTVLKDYIPPNGEDASNISEK
jgi:hypothetical protein